MGWSIGYDTTWHRDIGYGVPATCDHPGCGAEIDRGLAHVCANQQPYGGDDGCGLYFCEKHLGGFRGKCERCDADVDQLPLPFDPTPDVPRWLRHKLNDPSWQQWRDENPAEVAQLRAALATAGPVANPAESGHVAPGMSTNGPNSDTSGRRADGVDTSELHAAAADVLRGGAHEGDCVAQPLGPCVRHLQVFEARLERLRRALVAAGVPVPRLGHSGAGWGIG